MGFALRITQAKGGLGVVENKVCILYFFFLVRCGGGGRGGVCTKIRKSENHFSLLGFVRWPANGLSKMTKYGSKLQTKIAVV
jgi:hypothetical protein